MQKWFRLIEIGVKAFEIENYLRERKTNFVAVKIKDGEINRDPG